MSLTIDLEELPECCTNHALEFMFKAMADGMGADASIWNPHENVFIRRVVELFTSRGLGRIERFSQELEQWLAGEKFAGAARSNVPRPGGLFNRLDDSQLRLAGLYLHNLPPEEWLADDWLLLVDYLGHKHLPVDELLTEADWLVSRSVMMGKIQATLGDVSPDVADKLLAGLPAALPAAIPASLVIYEAFKVTDAAKHVMEFGRARCCENVVSLSDSARHRIKSTVLEHQARVVAGDVTATADTLKSKLFDDFGALNRDWRMIALTESGEVANQGMIASLPEGTKVKRMEMYNGACPHCRAIDGLIFTVVPASKKDKDGSIHVWVGKNNVGRSASPNKRTSEGLVKRLPSERWHVAAGVQHPNCRGRWEKVVGGSASGGNAAFDAWLDKTTGGA